VRPDFAETRRKPGGTEELDRDPKKLRPRVPGMTLTHRSGGACSMRAAPHQVPIAARRSERFYLALGGKSRSVRGVTERARRLEDGFQYPRRPSPGKLAHVTLMRIRNRYFRPRGPSRDGSGVASGRVE
jgi:hypothetical protein